jgi:hypothetical protein
LGRVRVNIVATENKKIITYSVCEFVALFAQHAKRMRHFVICGLSEFTIFFLHYLIVTQFSEESCEYNYFDFLWKFCLKYSLFLEQFSEILLSTYIGLRAKYPLFLSGFNET